jgi:hypothetical protein
MAEVSSFMLRLVKRCASPSGPKSGKDEHMSSELIKLTRDWTAVAGAVLVVGPIAGSIAGRLQTETGLQDASPFTASSTVSGIVVGTLVLVIALCYGILVGRIAHARLGLICSGLVLTWAAWRFGTFAALIRDAGDASPVSRLAIEGGLFGALLAAGCAVLLLLSRSVSQDRLQTEPLKKPVPAAQARAQDWAISAAAVCLAGLFAAWLLARSPLQGQVFASAVGAGVVGAAVGRSVSMRAPMLAILIGGFSLALIGPLVGVYGVSGDALTRLYADQWPGLGLISPFDWLAGVLVGAPLGEMWAHSMVDRQTAPTPKPKPAVPS